MAWRLRVGAVNSDERWEVKAPHIDISEHHGTLRIGIGSDGLTYERTMLVAPGQWIDAILDHVPDGEE